MEINSNVQECPDAATDESSSQQLVMRVLKLRWIGMESEAGRLQGALSRVARDFTLLAGPFDTD